MKIFSTKHPPSFRAGGGGFSLVEVVVAVSLLSAVFIAIYGAMTMNITVTEVTRENLRATQIMLDKMEGLRLYNWTQLNNTNFLQSSFTNWFYETNNIGLSNALGNGVEYTGTVSVSAWPFNTSYSTNMRQVTVTVGWTSEGDGSGIGGVPHSRTMSTYVSEYGLQNYVFND